MAYWKVLLSASALLGSQSGLPTAARLLRTYPLPIVLDLLSRASILLAETPFARMLETQSYLAQQFFPERILRKADEWINGRRRERGGKYEAYFFGHQQVLTAMVLALCSTRRFGRSAPREGPYEVLGRALLHIVNDIDPLQAALESLGRRPSTPRRRDFMEFVIRNSFFNTSDDYRYLLTRYHHMFLAIAPNLSGDPDFVDIPAQFMKVTGLPLDTYIHMGIGLLSHFKNFRLENAGRMPALISSKAFFAHTCVRRLVRPFFRVLCRNRRQFRKATLAARRRYGSPHYNFLEAETHPLVRVRGELLCCLSLGYLERKFASGVHYIVLDSLSPERRKRYLRFVGRVFERYVQATCERTFSPDRFACGITYGDHREAADGWILYPDAAIVIEAKSAHSSLEFRLSGSFGDFEKKVQGAIIQGAKQLNRVIEDFRAGAFAVKGRDHSELRVLYPVVVTLDHVPLDPFLTDYFKGLMDQHGLFRQPGVRPLTILSVKDLEQVDGIVREGYSFKDLLQQRLGAFPWNEMPFRNFLHQRFPGGVPMSVDQSERMRQLLRDASLHLFGKAPD